MAVINSVCIPASCWWLEVTICGSRTGKVTPPSAPVGGSGLFWAMILAPGSKHQTQSGPDKPSSLEEWMPRPTKRENGGEGVSPFPPEVGPVHHARTGLSTPPPPPGPCTTPPIDSPPLLHLWSPLFHEGHTALRRGASAGACIVPPRSRVARAWRAVVIEQVWQENKAAK